MSFCCENPIDLGCRSACAPITLPVVISETAFYTIVYEFAGALISCEFEAVPVDGYLQVPSYVFNESQYVTFQIYDADKVLVGCFKARMLSGNTTIEHTPPSPLVRVDTSMNKLINPYPCANGLHVDALSVNVSTQNGFKTGTIFNFEIDVVHGGNQHPYQLYYDQALTQPILQNKYVLLNPLAFPLFYLAVQLSNCNQKYEVTAVVTSIENMEDGYYNGTNTPVNYTVN